MYLVSEVKVSVVTFEYPLGPFSVVTLRYPGFCTDSITLPSLSDEILDELPI
jgi:hypothetical protein